MKTVLYIGNNDTSKIFNDAAENAGFEIQSRFAENMDSKNILALLKGLDYYAVIINSTEIPKAVENLESILETIVEDYGETKLCLMCPGAKKTSTEIRIALNAGVQFIMPYTKNKGKIHVFKQLIDGQSTSNIEELFSKKKTSVTPTPVKKIEKEKGTNDKPIVQTESSYTSALAPKPLSSVATDKVNKSPITVSVGGCIERMGTTLVAIQILKSLADDGAKVCYVDSTLNDRYMKCLRALYSDNIQKDEFNRRFILGDIDFYYEVMRDTLEFILSQDYDYILYDFGNIYDNEKKTNMFLKMDNKILCCGAKCNEYGNALSLLGRFEREDVKFVFNLVPESYVPMVRKTFAEEKHKDCYFMPYIKSEFFVSSKTFLTIGKMFEFKNKQNMLSKIKEIEKKQKENNENE